MKIDYRIFDGPRRCSLAFDFMPSMYPDDDGHRYDRNGPDTFSIREQAFLFIEGMIADAYPDWRKGYHWGTASLSREVWFDVLDQFPRLRRDVRGNLRWETIVKRYAFAPGLLPTRHKFHRRALLHFLDRFESRVRSILERYPYLVTDGI